MSEATKTTHNWIAKEMAAGGFKIMAGAEVIAVTNIEDPKADRAAAHLMAAANETTRSLKTLLQYFGGPVGVSMQELGADAYVSIDIRVRIGDLMAARYALSKAEGK